MNQKGINVAYIELNKYHHEWLSNIGKNNKSIFINYL